LVQKPNQSGLGTKSKGASSWNQFGTRPPPSFVILVDHIKPKAWSQLFKNQNQIKIIFLNLVLIPILRFKDLFFEEA
jgi:hypothetical protein